jgi:hypothetical protein
VSGSDSKLSLNKNRQPYADLSTAGMWQLSLLSRQSCEGAVDSSSVPMNLVLSVVSDHQRGLLYVTFVTKD